MIRVGYHATIKRAKIETCGYVAPIRMPSVYLFSDEQDAWDYALELSYDDVVIVNYDTGQVSSTWKPSYSPRGKVVKLKEGEVAWLKR